MTATAFWPQEAARLREFAGRADLGLHFTLTDQQPAGPMPALAPKGRLPKLPKLAALSLFGLLPLAEIEAELERQLDRFEIEIGRPPDHLDGHQHVHALPGICDAVLRVAARRLPKTSYIRITDPPPEETGMRARIIGILGRELTSKLKGSGGAANRSFAGVRNFQERASYLDLAKAAIASGDAGHLVMCHPGLVDDALIACDSVTHQREEEYRTLKSDAFGEWLVERGIVLVTSFPDP